MPATTPAESNRGDLAERIDRELTKMGADPLTAEEAAALPASRVIRDPAKRRCGYCRRPIFMTISGAWYHSHNASVSCHPGSGDGKKAF